MKQVNQTQTQGIFPRFEHPALRPRLHPEGFLTTITSQRVTITPEYPTPQSQIQVSFGDQKTTNPLLKKLFPLQKPYRTMCRIEAQVL